ncbi:hypothetical protein DSO57_1036672 [Entomophthora muscae]|uniref:Uncharacterized protein n=1 Tax=Entomophthora muscae TaxID=34485 RepID=A0ACC2TA80_9FUNG|nr:hypothetical protein DSO57_1036672 [Entomophthora muscae]
MPFEVYNHIGDDHFVHIGSKICLRHLATKRYIRSTARCYNGGSSQQMVIAASEQPEHEDWWQVCTAHGQQTPSRLQGSIRKCCPHLPYGHRQVASLSYRQVSCFRTTGGQCLR